MKAAFRWNNGMPVCYNAWKSDQPDGWFNTEFHMTVTGFYPAAGHMNDIHDTYITKVICEYRCGTYSSYYGEHLESGKKNECFPHSCPSGTTLLNPAESTRSYSSVWDSNPIGTGHARSMIDSIQAWSAQYNEVGEWMMIDLESSLPVAGLAIQGRATSSTQQWVTGYTVQYWLDGETSADAKYIDSEFMFTVPKKLGSYRDGEYNEIYFVTGVVARYFKITVKTWTSHISMRAGVLMCN